MRPLQGALGILVLTQMSQFRFREVSINTVCPITTFPRGSETDTREELAGASL